MWSPQGLKVLGTPIGSEEFTEAHVQERLEDEKKFWEAIPEVPDLQSAWQLLLQCAGPRSNHLLRTLPPSMSKRYAAAHDEGMWETAIKLLHGLPGSDTEVETAKMLATLPMRLGGLGLRSAERTAQPAYWASWADALGMLHERLPAVAARAVAALQNLAEVPGCFAEAASAGEQLAGEGFFQRPQWSDLHHGARSEQHISTAEHDE